MIFMRPLMMKPPKFNVLIRSGGALHRADGFEMLIKPEIENEEHFFNFS